MIHRALAQGIGIITLAGCSAAGWIWIFYGPHAAALWWRREYIYAALSVPIIAGVVLAFRKAVRASSSARALLQVGLMLFTCSCVVAVVVLVGLWATLEGVIKWR